MQTKNIKCPKCGVVLEVRNSKNEAVKIIKCPQCRVSLKVKFQQETEETLDAVTHIAGRNNTYNTVLGCGTPRGARAYIVCGQKEYELREGSQIVGRKAIPSTADIQLDVDDRYISRHNAVVTVKNTEDRMTVTIKNYKNLNPIYVGKVELNEGDEVMLSDGTEFLMGTTKMTLKIVNNEN